MRKIITTEDLERAASQLNKSERGRQAMRDLLSFLDNGAMSLDAKNGEAVITILRGAWGELAGTTKDALRDLVGDAVD